MYNSQDVSRATAIAIRLLQSRNPSNIDTLKLLLSFIGSPRCIREILAAAVCRISDTSPETTTWLLQHPDCLRPEIDVVAVIHQHLSSPS